MGDLSVLKQEQQNIELKTTNIQRCVRDSRVIVKTSEVYRAPQFSWSTGVDLPRKVLLEVVGSLCSG